MANGQQTKAGQVRRSSSCLPSGVCVCVCGHGEKTHAASECGQRVRPESAAAAATGLAVQGMRRPHQAPPAASSNNRKHGNAIAAVLHPPAVASPRIRSCRPRPLALSWAHGNAAWVPRLLRSSSSSSSSSSRRNADTRRARKKKKKKKKEGKRSRSRTTEHRSIGWAAMRHSSCRYHMHVRLVWWVGTKRKKGSLFDGLMDAGGGGRPGQKTKQPLGGAQTSGAMQTFWGGEVW
jgi:hypothetical protein